MSLKLSALKTSIISGFSYAYPILNKQKRWAVLLMALSIPISACSRSSVDDLSGSWEGTYFCNQGLTNLNLIISTENSSTLNATFNFYTHESNSGIPSGSFRMSGFYDEETKKLDLKATDWINQPPGYVMVDLSGNLSKQGNEISGNVNGTKCSTFSVKKS